jgi:uncharacterized protein (TIGR02145 family)
MHKLISIIFLFSIFGVFSQSIENVDFRAEGKTIVVTYSFFYSKVDTTINVELVFKDQQGGLVAPKTISGDIKNVNPGESKRIVWDVLADGISLSGKYKAEIKIIRFNSVKIGNQIWMTENLNIGRFQNGDIIPEAKTAEEWKAAGNTKRPAWCYYHNDPKNGDKYGKLYNWYAVKDTRGLAPEGWHVPSDAEWTILSTYLGGEAAAGNKMKSTSGWNDNGNGTNNSGFSGLPGGDRGDNGSFNFVGSYGHWWSSSEVAEPYGHCWGLEYSYLWLDGSNKSDGFSVRCVNGPEFVEDKKLVKIETFVDEEAEFPGDNKVVNIETFVDEEAEFPGGYPAMMAWIQKNLVFPETAIENNVQGKCFLRFVVSAYGNISSVTVTKRVPDCPECDKASIKAIRSMPNWKAGKLNGKSVSSYCSIPINFFSE